MALGEDKMNMFPLAWVIAITFHMTKIAAIGWLQQIEHAEMNTMVDRISVYIWIEIFFWSVSYKVVFRARLDFD